MLFLWYTSSDDLIRTILEKVWFFLKEELHLCEEVIPILLLSFRRYLSSGKIIDNVSIPVFLKIARMCSSGKSSLIGVFSVGALRILDK